MASPRVAAISEAALAQTLAQLRVVMTGAGWAPDEIEAVAQTASTVQLDGQPLVRLSLDGYMIRRHHIEDGYQYLGYHATSASGLCGVLRDRRVRRLPWSSGGANLILARASLYGSRPAERKRILKACLASGLASSGLVLELRHSNARLHTTLHSGGHEAEAAESDRQMVTCYSGRQRWTFPQDNTEVVNIFVDAERFLQIRVADELADAAVFGEP